ncbi:MAG: hypothetical protein K2O30_03900 [Duncaniella sp.]|nr:hypothetical protein [Duncaniella sp.]
MKSILLSIAILGISAIASFPQAPTGELSVTGSKNPSDPYMELYNSSDRTPWADYYLYYTKKGTEMECIGYDAAGKAFVLKAPLMFNVSEKAVNAAVDKFIAKYVAGTDLDGKTNADIIRAAESGDKNAAEVLSLAAKASKKKLQNSLPVVECIKYNLKSRYGEFKQSGTFEPFEYQTEAAIQRYIDKQAKKFGYKQSTDRNEIYNRFNAGDAETVDFVNARLSIKSKK